jgi:hypothetical protein
MPSATTITTTTLMAESLLGTVNQVIVTKSGNPPLGPTVSSLKPRHAKYDHGGQGKCLDVYNYAHYGGAPVVQWDCLGGVNSYGLLLVAVEPYRKSGAEKQKSPKQ